MKTTKPKIGILALTLELYETLAPGVRENRESWLRRDVLAPLAAQIDVEFRSAVFTAEGIHEELDYLERAGADAVVIVFLTYAPSQLVLTPLKKLRVPLLIWNIQELFGVDETYDQNTLLENHGVHGTQDLANVLVRAGVPFEYVTSHASDLAAFGTVIDFAQAAHAKRAISLARFGLLGTAFPGMGDFSVDTTQWVSHFGCSWTSLSLEEYILRAEKMDDTSVSSLVREYRSLYDVAADVTDEDLQHTARAELSIRSLVDEARLDGFSFLFTSLGDDERVSTVPFVAASRMMADGYGFGGEGDIVSAMTTRMLHLATSQVSFTEIFTIDYQGNALFLSHMGEANVAMARTDRKVPLVARPSQITRTRNRQLSLVTTFAPGKATLVALVQAQNGWRMIAAPVQIEDFGPLPSLCVPHSKIKVLDGVRQFLTAYAKAGGTHHNALCVGDVRCTLRILADLMNVEYVELFD